MPQPPLPDLDPEAIFTVLTAHQVDFIVVGGGSAIINGVPINTLDLDIVHSRTPENLNRLVTSLRELQAVYRDLAGRRIEPTASHLATTGHHLLLTAKGPLDVLGTIDPGYDYDFLLNHSTVKDVGGRFVRVIDLETLIASKEAAGRDKDKIALLVIKRTLEEQRKREGAGD